MRHWFAIGTVVVCLAGCHSGPDNVYSGNCPDPMTNAPVQPAATAYPNPVFLPVADPQCAWETIVDVVHGYFHIEREEPVRVVGSTVLEGSITTVPEVSPTIFEPWRTDTVDHQQRVENTLQTMRRRAVIRVIPGQGGFWIDVAVFKELEDLRQPEKATATIAAFQDNPTLTGIVNPVIGEPASSGWLPKGRDAILEQYMIGNLLSQSGQKPVASTILQQPVPLPAVH